MKLGIFGFPKVGKTTLFNLLTKLDAATDKFTTGRAAPNIASAKVADPRVERLSEMFKPKKTTLATVLYVDVAGLKQGDVKEGVDLSDLRTVDAIVHVVRAFDDDEIQHAPGPIDPKRDIVTMEDELLLADLITVEQRLERLALDIPKRRDENLPKERDALVVLKKTLDDGQPARVASLSEEEWRMLRGFQFLSAKPIMHVINLGEERNSIREKLIDELGLTDYAARDQTAITYALGRLETEISKLDAADAREFLDEYGLVESGIDRIVRNCYALQGLISFFTVGEDEVRAWTIRKGTTAENAAAVIHSDLKRGFIRAEVMGYQELIDKGTTKAVRDAGLFRLEGRGYVVQDGEIVHIRSGV